MQVGYKNCDSGPISGFSIDHCWTVTCRQHLDGAVWVIAPVRRPSNNKRRRTMHRWILLMTKSFDVTPQTTEQNLIVRTGKSEAEVTNKKDCASRYCIVEATYWQTHNIARPLCDVRASSQLTDGDSSSPFTYAHRRSQLQLQTSIRNKKL